MQPLNVSAWTVTSALGCGRDAHWQALREERSGLKPQSFDSCALTTYVGEVGGLERPLEGALAAWDCRNNRLAQLGLQQDGFSNAVARVATKWGRHRIGVFVGTSTSGVHQTELAYREWRRPLPNHFAAQSLLRESPGRPSMDARSSHATSPPLRSGGETAPASGLFFSLPCEAGEGREGAASATLPAWFDHRRTQNIFSVADFVRTSLELSGPAFAMSTACSSSAKVFASAYRAIAAGHCDAAVVGGVDSLCLTTLYGFNSLQLISSDVCRPADAKRNGLSIGEAAGFAVLERGAGTVSLLGYGESSDAHHMSAPDPQGRGAAAAMRAALAAARLEPAQIDYINLHGTATPANDLAEDQATVAVFGRELPQSSTKGWTGHTLGAAGIVEAAIGLICIEEGFMPRSLNTLEKDPALSSNVLMQSRRAKVERVLSNSFGFGGNNCSLIFGRTA